MTSPSHPNNLYNQVSELLHIAQTQVVRTINRTMTQTYFEIGRLVVKDEQGGSERAEYGKAVLKDLAQKLTKEFGKGFSEVNLKNMRKFYLTYSISQTLSAKLQSSDNKDKAPELLIRQTASAEFKLSWSHYLFLMRIDNENERKFYEIESEQNNWSLRELKRQFNTSLYERLALSRDKDEAVVRYTLLEDNDQIFASKYQTVLPSKEEFKSLLES
ncbi:MAG: DUF1016 N-terminal domain-containing protein [Bacteroidales bacterium]